MCVCNMFCFHILVKNVASSVKSQLQSEPFFTARQHNKYDCISTVLVDHHLTFESIDVLRNRRSL